MSSEKPKRPWFRFHLLTLVMMTLAVSIFAGLNPGNERQYIADYDVNGPIYSPVLKSYRSVGWPIPCDVSRQIIFVVGDVKEQCPIELPNIRYALLYLDGLICLSAVSMLAILCESLIRRR